MQVDGNVVATANAGLLLAAGAGVTPTLVLAGASNIQNINSANSMTLTLPALSISAGTVNIGNSAGFNGNVVLSGLTALTGASPVVNMNAGSLTVSSTLGGTGGANVQVNSGATLIGGPAGLIQIPLTVNSGGALVPNASQASTPLVGNSLTIKGGGALQWAYSGTGAEGTLALGNNTLNLPAGNGSQGYPVFRPQYSVAPALGTYVMTWNSPPVNKPAWTFDGSLLPSNAYWGFNGASTWDVGTNWNYATLSGSLSYTAGGLQLAALGYNITPGTVSPGAARALRSLPSPRPMPWSRGRQSRSPWVRC